MFQFQRSAFRIGVRILALIVVMPLLATSADAQRGHGGGIGGGISRGGGIGAGVPRAAGGGFGGIGRSAPMIHAAPMGRFSPGPRTFAVPHVAPRFYPRISSPRILSPRIATPRRATTVPPRITRQDTRRVITGGPRQIEIGQRKIAGQTQGIAGREQLNRNLITRSVRDVGRASVLRNSAFASLSSRHPSTRALADTTFRGQFAGYDWRHHKGGWHWRHRHPLIVIGWIGPLFWPYAYYDFVDYTFWPYAYDVFWPYAYDDLYVGVFGPYAYEGAAYAELPARGRRARAAPPVAAAEVCGERAPALTDWPIQQIAQTVEANDTQQALLDGLKNATAKAIEILQSACPSDLPSTPTGRLAAMRKRIETMLQALAIVRPALEEFYNSLSDEQKARFNAINPEAAPLRTAGRVQRLPDLTQVCSGQAAKAADVPAERIEQALHPTESQRSALEALNAATAKAADLLKAKCPEDETLTPPGRVAAMEQRLNAMLDAIKIVQPALDAFYEILSDEQKARFNQLGSRQT